MHSSSDLYGMKENNPDHRCAAYWLLLYVNITAILDQARLACKPIIIIIMLCYFILSYRWRCAEQGCRQHTHYYIMTIKLTTTANIAISVIIVFVKVSLFIYLFSINQESFSTKIRSLLYCMWWVCVHMLQYASRGCCCFAIFMHKMKLK